MINPAAVTLLVGIFTFCCCGLGLVQIVCFCLRLPAKV